MVSKQEAYGEEEEKEEEEEEEGDQAKVWMLNFGMNWCMKIMDSSMILIQELLEYGLLGFHLDINLFPFSRVLLGKHSNSIFKGSLVEKP